MSSIDSRLPAICRLRATAPISNSEFWSKPFGAGLMATGAVLLNVTVSLSSPPRLRPASIRHAAASTSAIERPPLPCASTAMCLASLAKGTPRARPDRAPSASSLMRSFGPAGATVIAPPGEAMFACDSNHPASMVSARGTATAKRPETLSTLKPSARPSPQPPPSAAILGNPRQWQAGLGQRLPERRLPAALLVAVDGLRVGEIRKYPLCGICDDILDFRHGVPRSAGT